MKILYEDNHVIAVFKPCGLLAQGDGSNHSSLLDQVREFIKVRDKKPGNVFIGLLHRLDRNVSGIVLFAKTSKGASRLSEQFRERDISKIYHAWVEGRLERPKAILKHYLRRDEARRVTHAYDKPLPGSQEAMLFYEVLKYDENAGVGGVKVDGQGAGHGENQGANNTDGAKNLAGASGSRGASLVRIELMTGRRHQIRSQFGSIGHPIIGDVKYGAKGAHPDSLLDLYATELTFTTATTGQPITISLPVPDKPGVGIKE